MSGGRILITGAAGHIGRDLRRALADRYTLRLLDTRRIDAPGGGEVIRGDVADLELMRRACRDIDTVVHLAANPFMDAGFYESLLQSNIVGAYNVFQAAGENRCRRVVFASSLNVILGYPKGVPVTWDMPVNPVNMYGVSKCFGEAMGRCYANQGLSVICVRIGKWLSPGKRLEDLPRRERDMWADAWISARDLVQLLRLCIDIEGVDFAIVHAQSRLRNPRLDITHTCALLGYDPQDGDV